METTQGALFRLERWSDYWCLPLNPSKCEASFFSADPHQANLQPNLLLLGSRHRFNPIPTFLGVTFDRTLSFSKHVSLLKAKFFPRLKALRCISDFSWGPSKESLSLLYKAFLRPLLTYVSPGWFPFLSATISPNWNASTERPVAPSPAASRPSLPLFLYLRLLYLPYESPGLISLFRLMSETFVSQPPFPISGLARLGVKLRLCISSWRAFVFTYPLMLPSTSSREALLACLPFPPWNLPSFSVESTLTSPCSRSDPPLSLAKVRFSPSLTVSPPHDLVLWTDGSVPFPFGNGGSGVLANCSLCGTEATLSFSAGPVCSSFSAEACAILHALCWSPNKFAISRLFSSYLTLVLSSPPYPPSFLLSQTLWQIWQKLSFLSSCSIRLQCVSAHSFLPGNDVADELVRRGALLAPSAIPCSLCPLYLSYPLSSYLGLEAYCLIEVL